LRTTHMKATNKYANGHAIKYILQEC